MTSRSIVLGTAALLLMSAATPLHIGFSPTAAYAQQLTLEAAMAGNPSEFNAPQLRERIQLLRDAVQNGTLQGADRKAAQQKIKAYREVLQGIRAERQEARQDNGQAEQPRQGERTQRQVSEPKAERQAEKEERKAERQAEKDERQAERQAQREAERQTESQAQREAEQSEAERQAERQAERRAERQAQRQAERQEQRQAERQPEPEEVNRRAREIISDNRSAADLDNQALRQRLNQNREILGTDQLSRAQTQELRQQLRADREELRARVASRQDEEREARPARGSDDRTRGSRDRSRDSGDRMDDRNVSRILEERVPSDQLTERELELRVRVLSRALSAGNITVRQAEVARLLISRDREELRNRLHADRDRRRDRRRSGSRDYVLMEFEVGYRPPPVIYAAEAMPRDIQMQLIAPPMYQMQRAYTVQEISTNHDVREMMPGIEIDTLNFDFGSAEVRPEEIDKLDEIGIVIESIVAERPNEVFLIEGHTDAVGSDAANDALSQQRALAVKEALLDYFLIDPENLQTVGLGERYLKIQTPEPEEENRRVTVRRITPLLAGRG